MKISEKKAWNALEEVMDPEIHISLIDLGLIYKITVQKEKIHVLMTLTTVGCPLFSLIEKEVKDKLIFLGFKPENIKLELTFDPPWTMERITEKGRAMMGI
ncbi:hypothetical protein A2334_05715 [Candidatus Roizmanbacteria bacterium RIFOXYB2_FULL_38_10]|uniref:MIP18 family-like domain-containing protein n=1 Tax=Candidatus Roizmanbacteria bacterium RIFOXYD1_FULL_38_12 TaxID=1802093 RepID=A0A1F7L0N6_9BACT|nr:MAG: hypothetical protein A3K47_02835 [Candidatus Roizmanbacteria bacterium RIFOXYA2_FULL_38_14]OGK63704.1 MAG: hypothetical protein A3K27_02835 [Candidatus Roizmanbacteria bacterium RIFOXYA1_FULL_37_12]OGK65550.1 MAG: hypothetical protein A3K38_02835 [Candidatus Roizmanbacteria bacterium RIFOXYB1_FULL_40_23]OGK68334.1 MAG: hypothetical protein A2334_05715 [Candidatus Roizmanbacteria bacterium RIFOXYB2_FULL_38_10]OGK69955.1 MAG: hypothetical protein A3K21_02840 [Candidatus Roizmanbacteria ba